MNSIKTYVLVPNFDIPAEGPNAMKLGHIISNPATPNIPLNKTSLVPFPQDMIPTSMTKPGWTGTISQLRAKKFGLWARFLEIIGLGGEASVNSSGNNENYFTFESLDTMFVDPTEEYVLQSMKVDGVQRFIKASRYRKHVYMITGLKIARGASAIGSESITHGGKAKLGFDGAASGVPVAVGPEVEISSSRTTAVSFEDTPPFAFAIRLREISYKKGGDIVQREYRQGVVLGADSDDEEEREEGVAVIGLNPKDAEDFEGISSDKSMVQEEDEDIQCIALGT
jgi:hypothetical protein